MRENLFPMENNERKAMDIYINYDKENNYRSCVHLQTANYFSTNGMTQQWDEGAGKISHKKVTLFLRFQRVIKLTTTDQNSKKNFPRIHLHQKKFYKTVN
jgi:hypothetical protein